MSPQQPDPERPSYEAAREELVDTVRRLEAGGTTLEESLALWERGERLATVCEEWLEGARQRLDEVVSATGTSVSDDTTAASDDAGAEP